MQAFGKTDIGKLRNTNEDNFYCSNEKVGKLPNLFIIADGMGGHKAGDFASYYAVTEFVKYVRVSEEDSIEATFIKGINYINACIFEKSMNNEEYLGMGTTFVVCSVLDDKIIIANVGDSRLYIVNKVMKQITKDHSLYSKKNIITRAVGALRKIDIDIFKIDKMKDDSILMCSDGLTNMIEDDKILKIVNRNSGVEEVVNMLINEALDKGGYDNITTVLIQ